MPDSDDPTDRERLSEILTKIVSYQHALPDGRAVELSELLHEGILSPDDLEFLSTHSVTYKPHRSSDYHAMDMLEMSTADGGCLLIGPKGPELTQRTARLAEFSPVLKSFLKLPKPADELLLNVDFTEHDGMGVAPEMICFILRGVEWRHRLSAIRSVAAEFGLHPFQDAEIQGQWLLSFRFPPDPAHTAAVAVALLSRGCGFADDADIKYSAGALDEL